MCRHGSIGRRFGWMVPAALLWLVVACAPSPALAPPELTDRVDELPCNGVPMQIDDGYALVPVQIGAHDEPFLFLLDTGAGRTLITPSTRRVAGLHEVESEESRLIGATGEEQHTSYWLDTLRIGGITQTEMRVTEVDLYRFHRSNLRYAGVLGNDVLRHYNVEYNLPERRLCLYETGEEPEHFDLSTYKRVPFYRQMNEGGFITLLVEISGERARALLDTGSRHTIFNTMAAELDGAPLDQLPVQSETYGIGIGEATATRLYTYRSLRAREVEFASQQISVADLPIFSVLQRLNRPYILLGNDLVADRNIFIRYSSRELFFSPRAENHD